MGDWEFSFSMEDSLYSLVVSPGIDYSSENVVSRLFRPELDVHVDEVYGAEDVTYDRVFSMEADNPGFPNPVFRKVLGKLADYSDELILEGLESEVY